ncbi:sugar phosphate isomerase/epimerase [Telmatospirillum sp. J64-1]|uniref:sugar phosphate isomerase/epimerase family protein n=1 Tax=Telmatospirillum sp. J64-1 TaxID=2502183 RepID=UPI00115DAEA6|nr:sugar phosphate isomerase/epimerase family protein [Telmatospirillum sp. J64-1]
MNSLANTPHRLSINQATIRAQCDMKQAVEEITRAGISGIATWRDKVHEIGLAQAARLIRDAELKVSGHCRGGMFCAADKDGIAQAREDNLRAVEEAAELGAGSLILVVGGMPPGSKDLSGARQQVLEGLADLLPVARAAGVKLSIEPLHPMYAADRACVNTIGQALDLCDAIDPDASGDIGVAVDVYHVWWDPELERQIARAGKARLHAFHVCDWLVPTQDMLLDRGMMGDGVIDIPKIRSWVEREGYDGPIEVEIFSERDWWRRPAAEVLETCKERFATVC